MTRMFILAVGLVIGMVFNAAPLMAQCPTDDSGCPWSEMYLNVERFTQDDTVWNESRTKIVRVYSCARDFSINICYRCCSGKMEIRLSSIVPCEKNANDSCVAVKDWTRGCESKMPWRYNTEFWRAVDSKIMYRLNWIKCPNLVLSCDDPKTTTITSCDKDTYTTVVTYYKANCFRYKQFIELDPTKPEWRLVPCDGAGECTQVWGVCCHGSKMVYKRIVSSSTGGCYRLIGGDDNMDECFPACW